MSLTTGHGPLSSHARGRFTPSIPAGVIYVEPAQVRTDLLRRSDSTTYCNYKGPATWWSAVVGDTVVEDVAFSFDDPLPESWPIKGFLSFEPARVQVDAELPGGA